MIEKSMSGKIKVFLKSYGKIEWIHRWKRFIPHKLIAQNININSSKLFFDEKKTSFRRLASSRFLNSLCRVTEHVIEDNLSYLSSYLYIRYLTLNFYPHNPSLN